MGQLCVSRGLRLRVRFIIAELVDEDDADTGGGGSGVADEMSPEEISFGRALAASKTATYSSDEPTTAGSTTIS